MTWKLERVLIVGKTYPSYSTTHMEVVCTGGILEKSKELVRLHPIPYRHLSGNEQFKEFQWIRAGIAPDSTDSRPSTFRVRSGSIVLEGHVPSTRTKERRALVSRCASHFVSLEELHRSNAHSRTSLGIVRPASITRCRLVRRSDSERREWDERQNAVLGQERLFEQRPKPIAFPECRFMIDWKCEGGECKGHEMSFHQWGVHELYRRLEGDERRDEKTIAKMQSMLDTATRDVFFFLGNFRGHQQTFGIMQVASIVKPSGVDDGQGELF